MADIFTSDLSEWLDLMSSNHQLKFDVNRALQNFYSNVAIPDTKTILSFVRTRTAGYEARYKSSENKQFRDNLLITHSFGRFSGYQNGDIEVNNETFILDLSQDFVGKFHKEGLTNAIILPLDLLPGKTVDTLKAHKRIENPIFYAVESILSKAKVEDNNIDLKLNAIISNLALLDGECSNGKTFDDIKFFIYLSLKNNRTINLDMLSDHFFMSRRKIQYLFEDNDTTFRKVVSNTKAKIQAEG